MLPGSQRQNLKYIRQGRRQAYEALICQHYKSIYRFMVHLTANTNLAEDLTQETFVAAWANVHKFKGRASPKTWLLRIAYHKFIDSQRAAKHNTTLISNLKKDIPDAAQTPNPLYQLLADEHSYLLAEAIRRLQPPEYLLIVLHYFQDLSFREMAQVLAEPVGTTKWRTNRTLKKLRTFLSDGV